MHYYEQEDFYFDMEEFLNEKIDINKNLLKFEAFLGRKFKQEEIHDTVHFISKK